MADDEVVSERDREDIRLGRYTRRLQPSTEGWELGNGIMHCEDGRWVACRQGQDILLWDPLRGLSEEVPPLLENLELLDDLSVEDRADLKLGRLLRELPRSQPSATSNGAIISGLLHWSGDGSGDRWEVFFPGRDNLIIEPTPEAALETALGLLNADPNGGSQS